MRKLDRQVVAIDHRVLSWLPHQPVGIVGDELIGRRHRQHDDGVRDLVATPGAADLLPEAGARAGEAALDHDLQRADIDAQL